MRKMIGSRFERHPVYNLPAERLRAIEKTLQNRVQVFLNIPDHDECAIEKRNGWINPELFFDKVVKRLQKGFM